MSFRTDQNEMLHGMSSTPAWCIRQEGAEDCLENIHINTKLGKDVFFITDKQAMRS